MANLHSLLVLILGYPYQGANLGGTHVLLCEADRGILFIILHEWKGYTHKKGELNRMGPKMRPQTRGVSKLSHEWKGISKCWMLHAMTEQNKYGFVAFYVNFKKSS